jgi:hypothetical protein
MARVSYAGREETFGTKIETLACPTLESRSVYFLYFRLAQSLGSVLEEFS